MGRRTEGRKSRKEGRPRTRPPGRLRPRAAARLAARLQQAALDHRAGRFAAAEAGYREVLDAAPDYPGAARNYALLARSTGRLDLALHLAERAVASEPGEPSAHATLGSVFLETERTSEAIDALAAALALDPGHLNARFNLGYALRRRGEPEAAAAEFRRLTERYPDDAGHWIGLGGALLEAARPRDAMEAFERALALVPDDPDVLNELGLAHVDVGEFEAAARCYRRVIDRSPGQAHVWLNYTKTRRFAGSGRAEIEAAERVAERLDREADPPRVRRRPLRARQDARRPRRLRPCVRALPSGERDPPAAHALRPPGDGATRPGPRDAVRRGVVRTGAGLGRPFSAAHLHRRHAAFRHYPRRADPCNPSRGPRRGRAHPHPQPRAKARRDGRGRRRGRGGPPGKAELQAAARDYLGYIKTRAGGALRVTDKLPENFQHLGLIASILPNARIVHVGRDPMDVCVSNYVVRFGRGHGWSYDFDALASELGAHERLMRHWRTVLPSPVHELSYERLTASFEAESRRLLDLCGLDWDERCLEFHRTERAVHTASGWQVRQPVYRRSVGRWRNYERHLAPLRAALRSHGISVE